jgi:hypothetical protein
MDAVVICLQVRQMFYEAAKKQAEPYTKIVEELPQMRREAVQLVRQAVGAGRRAYVLVNNRAEGNAPLTVEALVGILRGSCCGPQDPSILVLVLSPREILPLRLTFHPTRYIARDKALLSPFRSVAFV